MISLDWTGLTCLKTFRDNVTLPKHSSSTASCEMAIIIGSIRFKSDGNKYQRDRSIFLLISSNALLTRWPRSQAINTAQNP